MVDSGCDDILKAREMANKVSKAISKSYKLLELGVDGIYRPLLLLQKKKYAAVAVKCDAEGKITGQTLEKILIDSDRDNWFNAEDAKAYGFIDHIATSDGQVFGGKA